MAFFYSPSLGVLYDTAFASYTLPGDAVEVAPDHYMALHDGLAAQNPITMVAGVPTVGTAAPPSLGQSAAAAIMAGLTITLSGSVSLTALVPTDPATTGKLGAVVTTLVATGAFPGGGTSYPMKDSAGIWHTFTAAQYKAVAGSIAAYVAALDLIIDGNPSGTISLPSSTISIVV